MFRLLGPLAIGRGDDTIGLTVPKIRCMFAALLLDADQVVSLDRLADELWGDDPPRSAVANLRSYASALRRTLAAAGLDPARLVTTPGGYRLHVLPGECDVEVWESRAAEGAAALADGRLHDAVRHLDGGLAIWRGPALADVPVGPGLAARATALDERRAARTEDLFEARLRCGEGTGLVTQLRTHIAAHPTRERAYAQLMRELYAAGDAAGALEVYRQARRCLADQLGLEPGTELQGLQAAVLRRDPALTRPVPLLEVAPRQLPADVTVLVGRDTELGRLAGSPASVRVIHGPGGVGKSALAIRLAHTLASRYPDGQLYLDLQGSSPRLTPLSPGEVLGRFLRALGVPDDRVPTEPAEAAAMYRSLLAERRMLILLDNAVDAAQVRPLLPGTSAHLVLVTARRALSSLDGGELLALDVLDEEHALRMLEREADAAAARLLVDLCGRLPLALRIAGARLSARPDWSAQDLVDRLVDERHRLDELHTDDMAVRSCFQASYGALDETAARAFRLAGLARVPHISVSGMAALLGETRAVAASALDRLVEARLMEVAGDRFRLHDLLRLYAAECALAQQDALERARSLHRLMVYYLGTARRAVLQVAGIPRPVDPALCGPEGTDLVALDSTQQAAAWLDAELPCAVAIAEQAGEATEADRRYPAQLLRATSNYALRRDAGQVARLSETALRTCAPGDTVSEAIARNLLGQAFFYQQRYDESRDCLVEALRLWQDIGDLDGVAMVTNSLGILNCRAGALDESLRWYQASFDTLGIIGNLQLQAIVLLNMGEAYHADGRIPEAVASVRRGLDGVRADGTRTSRMMALGTLGVLHFQLGVTRSALRYLRRSLAMAELLRDPSHRVDMLLCQSEAFMRTGRLDLARADADRALNLSIEMGDRTRQGTSSRQVGKVLTALGEHGAAAAWLADAERLFRLHGQSHERWVEAFLGENATVLADAANDPRPSRTAQR
ncbi:BTAD domain-containing putative transcriptional regulator [Catellatospora citrea]|uniref:AfsR/SARP family transcriptional regulator n=1 Tax=Catellatospora citrea TaxID=53366 RepID=UPI0033D9778C